MFFKNFEYTNLSPFFRSYVNLNASKVYTAAALTIGLVAFNIIIGYSAGVFLRNFLFGLSFFFIAYWLVSIFTYLLKKSRFGVFTRMIQRFWKRALYLFWILEVGLFCIYLFLTVISPQEVAYMLDNQQLFFFYNNNFNAFFISLLKPLTIILLGNIYLLCHKYNTASGPLVAVLALLLINSLYDDFVQFFAINQHYTGMVWTHTGVETPKNAFSRTTHVGIWEVEAAELKLRPYMHYLYLLVFLKLWHTLFIVYFFLFFENARLYTDRTSFNVIAANIQNFYFLMFFNYILKISLIKNYLNYLGAFIYYWFYINHNSYDASYMYEIFSWRYVMYPLLDVSSLF